jgi:hypothetical protein|nr:MAG TPA: hypothetical protein [Caudoviricetes sp.]
MHPITVLVLILIATALIFILMEIKARAAVRRFEKITKHSQGE